MADERVPDVTTVESPPRQSLEYHTLTLDDEPIGGGGQGIVYRADVPNSTPPDQVALKEPAVESRTLARDDIDAFLEEAGTWKTVDRREREKLRWRDREHIVGVIDTGDDLPWIAMEYMDGESLKDRLASHPNGLPVEEALWVGECVCRGVELAHNYGIAHLDLKPANVLFRKTPDGVWDVPKIADWGLARVLAERTGTMDGLSLKYAAPEQFEPDEFGDPDMLTDVYQIGALVYAMLTGKPPYSGGQLSVMNDIVSNERPTQLTADRDCLPDAINEAVLLALEAEKTDRYRNIQTFEQALHAIRTDQPLPRTVASGLDTQDRQAQHAQSGPASSDETQSKGESSTASGSDDSTNETDTRAAIVDLIEESSDLTNAEIADAVGTTVPVVRDVRSEYESKATSQQTENSSAADDKSGGTKEHVLELISEQPEMTNAEIADAVGTSVPVVRDIRNEHDEHKQTTQRTEPNAATGRLSETEKKILELSVKQSQLTNAEIADEVGTSVPVVRDVRDTYEENTVPSQQTDSGLDMETLSDAEEKIIDLSLENPQLTNAEIADEVGTSVPVVRDIRSEIALEQKQ
jgi:serine/threonine protein kinase